MGACRVKNHDAEGVAGPAIVTKEALEAGLFCTGLLVNGGDRTGGGVARGFAQASVIGLGTAQDGIDERGGRRAEIERGHGAAVTGLQKRLSFGRGKQQLVGAVGVVVQKFDTRDERPGRLPVSDSLGANEIAPRIGAEMRGIDSPKNAVPIGVVALCAQSRSRACSNSSAALEPSCRTGAAAMRAETRNIFLCRRLDSAYLRKKPRQEPP